ncbi:Transglutaminase-like superfamily protein [uncultured archaeon]|nr:Transglutaminase-like superfamily protein [uncultured archaeon]
MGRIILLLASVMAAILFLMGIAHAQGEVAMTCSNFFYCFNGIDDYNHSDCMAAAKDRYTESMASMYTYYCFDGTESGCGAISTYCYDIPDPYGNKAGYAQCYNAMMSLHDGGKMPCQSECSGCNCDGEVTQGMIDYCKRVEIPACQARCTEAYNKCLDDTARVDAGYKENIAWCDENKLHQDLWGTPPASNDKELGESCSANGECASGSCCGTCVDNSDDQNNCGKCGNMCPYGSACQAGKCLSEGGKIIACPEGYTSQYGTCVKSTAPDITGNDKVEIKSDGESCGYGPDCLSGRCVDGVCAPSTLADTAVFNKNVTIDGKAVAIMVDDTATYINGQLYKRSWEDVTEMDISDLPEGTPMGGTGITFGTNNERVAIYINSTTAIVFSKSLIDASQASQSCGAGECYLDGSCFSTGTRKMVDYLESYCDTNGTWSGQHFGGASCQNDYACRSNICDDGTCASEGEGTQKMGVLESIIKMITDFLDMLFGLSQSGSLNGQTDGGYISSGQTGSVHGTIQSTKNVTVEDAFMTLTDGTNEYTGRTDRYGEYSITGVPAGSYTVIVGKQGYKNTTSALDMNAGSSFSWNFTIAKDCMYYPVNTTANYVLRYGYNTTVYNGYQSYVVMYPEGAEVTVYPDASKGLTQSSTSYQAGNRMMTWKLDNTAKKYSSVTGYIYMDMKGTQALQLFNRREMRISDAAASESGHGYLGGEELQGKASGGTMMARAMIDPYDSEIKAIAERVRGETGGDDVWTVAKALFVWLKSNTEYYHGPDSDTYTKSAVEVLHSGNGDCDELASLYLSLLRSAGIPARFVRGYSIEKSPNEYIPHQWVEFYDGEWVPVEVATSENSTFVDGITRGVTGNVTNIVNTRFGYRGPGYVQTFVDDGTSDSINIDYGSGGAYYDKPSVSSEITYYDLVGYDQMYNAVCADGTRTLVKDMG